MSKSLGNYIGVEDPPEEMFGKVMSLPDDLLLDYFELLTDVPDAELEELRRGLRDNAVHPMEAKKRLGRELVAQFHSPQAGREAEGQFDIDEVAGLLVDKLVRRHPHVFADGKASTPAEVEEAWALIKAQEKADKQAR